MAHVQPDERTAFISPEKREKSVERETFTPGPGHYQSMSQFDNDLKQHFTIGTKANDFILNKPKAGPGPGEYSPSYDIVRGSSPNAALA